MNPDDINQRFLDAVRESYETYLSVSTSRSTAKLKPLHGQIAQDVQDRFGKNYTVISQGFGDDREECVQGRYYPKNVDITVCNKYSVPVAGYAVKFIMRNYSQNSNNYFENMLGETANIRANGIPYFQIFITFDVIPYYGVGNILQRYEILNEHHLEKYIALSKDDPYFFCHTPNKTLIVILDSKNTNIMSYSEKFPSGDLGGLILNNYARFIEETFRIVHEIDKQEILRIMKKRLEKFNDNN